MTDKTPSSTTGGCLCGAVRYRVQGKPLGVVHCHCSMCRRHSGAAFATFVSLSKQAVVLTHGTPALYRSSSKGVRGYCKQCGSSLSFCDESNPDIVWISAGSLDDPGELSPTEHWYSADMVEWIHMEDGLPRYPEQPPATDH